MIHEGLFPRYAALAAALIWGTDRVHSHNKVVGAIIYPRNIGLGETRSVKLSLAGVDIQAAGAQSTRLGGND